MKKNVVHKIVDHKVVNLIKSLMENPEKTWTDTFAKEMQKAPPEPSFFD